MRVVQRYHWAYQAAFRHDPREPLAALDVPVLLLNAEHDMLADKDPAALQIARDARLVTIPELPGQLHLRAPDAYVEELRRFLS